MDISSKMTPSKKKIQRGRIHEVDEWSVKDGIIYYGNEYRKKDGYSYQDISCEYA